MKMRVRGNTIRFRLTQTEVGKLKETGTVTEMIDFGGGRGLSYQLTTSAEGSDVRAEFSSDRISIIIPKAEADLWTDSGQDRISGSQDIGEDRFLSLLIEKDYTCLEPRRGEDDRDTFPHPRGNAKC